MSRGQTAVGRDAVGRTDSAALRTSSRSSKHAAGVQSVLTRAAAGDMAGTERRTL